MDECNEPAINNRKIISRLLMNIKIINKETLEFFIIIFIQISLLSALALLVSPVTRNVQLLHGKRDFNPCLRLSFGTLGILP